MAVLATKTIKNKTWFFLKVEIRVLAYFKIGMTVLVPGLTKKLNQGKKKINIRVSNELFTEILAFNDQD